MNKKVLAFSKQVRINILKVSHKAKSSHVGSCFSIVEILTVLYNNVFKDY